MALKTITLLPGECFILPKDATVSSIVTTGSITVTTECGITLPTPVSYKCGVFYLFIDATGDDDTAMEEEYVYYNKITIGNNSYILNELVDGVPVGTLNLHVTDSALFQFMDIQYNTLGNRKRIAVYFQTPEDLFEDVVLQISDRGTLYNLPPYEATCEEYPTPE